ncbi:hypothetical protein [Accumulibacter sp.]|uniref:hypothetical protein n=1 Tax=Accumulibacter sp. TaxID=2053492 RepID=UPI0035B38AEC
MRKTTISLSLGLILALSAASASTAGEPLPTVKEASPAATDAIPASEVLKGTWVRPDGGYTIVIKNVGATGQLEATYFNPNQLPFAKAEAAREGGKLRAFFELRAGGYDGSTYDLAYDPASDRLTGTYYQAVAKQRYDVFFARRR